MYYKLKNCITSWEYVENKYVKYSEAIKNYIEMDPEKSSMKDTKFPR